MSNGLYDPHCDDLDYADRVSFWRSLYRAQLEVTIELEDQLDRLRRPESREWEFTSDMVDMVRAEDDAMTSGITWTRKGRHRRQPAAT